MFISVPFRAEDQFVSCLQKINLLMLIIFMVTIYTIRHNIITTSLNSLSGLPMCMNTICLGHGDMPFLILFLSLNTPISLRYGFN